MKTILLTLSLTALTALIGCSGRDKRPEWTKTPAGYSVQWYDQGTVATGRLTLAEILNLFDQKAIPSAINHLAQYGATPGEVKRAAYSHAFRLIDNKNFPTSASGTGFAGGMVQENFIYLALYSRKVVATREEIPVDAPPWTIAAFAGKWSYGILDPERPFPAIGHELGHTIYGNGFEH